jgi:hypothetical protein
MKKLYNLILLTLIPATVFATNFDGKFTKNKVVKKEFMVNSNATLSVSNKYGNIDIVTWNENQIAIEVSITTNGNDEEKVQKRLDQIQIEFEGNLNNVSAKTLIEKSTSNWSFWGKNNNVSMEINYKIKMPVTNNLNVSNDYGTINLDVLEGAASIDCDYGKIIIGELKNANNKINIDYTNNSTIDFIKNANINCDYSSLHVEKAQVIDLNGDYSQLSFGSVEKLNYDMDYGNLKIDNAHYIDGNSDYLTIKINKLSGVANIIADYGSLKISELTNELEKLNIKSSYLSAKIGVNSSAAFVVKASFNYGGFKYDEGFSFTKEIEKSTSKYYEGYFNNSNASAIVNLDFNYGSVSFTNN